MYHVEITTQAAKELKKLPKPIQGKVVARIRELATEPVPNNAKMMVGYVDTYRIRFSEWRVVYKVQNEKLVVLVIKIGNRKNVYKNLPKG